MTNSDIQTDHDILIQLQTYQDNNTKTLSDVQSHVAIMNSEQGIQAVQIAKMGAKLDMMYSLAFAIGVAVIGSVVTSVWNLVVHYRGK